MKKNFYILTIIWVVSIAKVFAQDPVFSQFYATPTFLNPGLIADNAGINASINSRFNTNSQLSSYNLNQLSIIVPFEIGDIFSNLVTRKEHRSGAALSVYREGTGDESQLNTMGLLLTLSHSIQLQKEHFLSLGIQGGYIYKKQGDDFMWGSQYEEDYGYNSNIEPSLGDINLTSDFPTINAGLVYFYNSSSLVDYFKKFNFDAFVGVSVYNLNTPNQSFYENAESDLPMTLKVHGGLKYYTNKYFYLFPNVLWVRQNANNQINLGTYASIKTAKSRKEDNNDFNTIIGVWYRVGDSFIASLGLQIKQVKLAVSYDFNASSFEYNNRGEGALEISLKYTVKNAKRKSFERGLIYPSF